MAASTWWPTPSSPSKWFSAEQIAKSQAYHRPPSTMSIGSVAVSVGLGFVIANVLSSGSNQALAWLLTPLAVLVPLLVYSWWFHTRHRPAFGANVAPANQVLTSALLTTAVAFTAINVFVIIIRGLEATAVSLGMVSVLAAGIAVFVPQLLAKSDLQDVPTDAAVPFVAIAEWAGVRCRFKLDPTSDEANARSVNNRGRKVVVISKGLLAMPAELQSLVVAHEVAHLKLNHVSKLRFVSAARAVLAASLAWLFALVIGDSIQDQSLYPVIAAALLAIWWVTAPVQSFVQRHFERQADVGGYELLGTVSTNLGRQLYARQFSNLSPSPVQKLFSRHPPPAERLEVISRLS